MIKVIGKNRLVRIINPEPHVLHVEAVATGEHLRYCFCEDVHDKAAKLLDLYRDSLHPAPLFHREGPIPFEVTPHPGDE